MIFVHFPNGFSRKALRLRRFAWLVVVCLSLTAWPVAALSGDEDGTVAVAGPDPERPLAALNVHHWGEGDGLPQNFVSSVAQTPNGFLWAGTERGLARFDGTQFTVFTSGSGEGLPSSWVTELHADSEGVLWVGTGEGELARYYDGAFGTVLDDALGSGPVQAIVQDREGDLWILTQDEGLVRLAAERVDDALPVDDAAAKEVVDPGEDLSLAAVSAIALGPDGDVWAAGPGGVDRLEPGGAGVDPGVAQLPDGVVATSLVVDAQGDLWVGTAGQGLYRVQDDVAEPLPGHPDLENAFVSVLMRDTHGALWIGTDGSGLFRHWDGQVERAPSRPEAPTHLVRDLLEDREGNVWMGLTGVGLGQLRDGLFDNHGMPEGLSMNVALGIREAGDGSVWVATPGQGVNRIQDDTVEVYGRDEGLGSNFAMTVAEDPDGAIWVGTIGGGLSRIRNGDVETFGTEHGLLAQEVSVVEWDRAGRLWTGFQGSGLQVWDGADEEGPGEPRTLGVDDGLPNPVITTVHEDESGSFWVGTRGGVVEVEAPGSGGGGELEIATVFGVDDGLPHGLVTGLYGDSDGGLWISTMGGLARFRDGEMHRFGPEHGFPDVETLGVVEDARGGLWIGTGEGVLRASRGDLDAVAEGEREVAEVEVFSRPEGLRSGEANGAIHPAAWRAQDGAVWIPTMAGAVRAEPELRERVEVDPRPVLEALIAGDDRYGVGADVTLPLGERTLEFLFAAPTFVAPERVNIRYRLEGFDDAWEVVTGSRREARYTSIPPGEYRFRMEVSDRQGEWSGHEAAMTVEVPPRHYERTTVRAGGLLLLVVLLGLGYRLRIRRIRRREEELMRLVAEREEALSALRAREEELRHAQKMEAVGTLAGGIAHDFNNLLSVVGMNARLAAEDVEESSPAQHELREAIRATDRAAELTQQLLQFSRRQLHRPEPVNLNQVVADVEQMLRRLIRADIFLRTRLQEGLPLARADRSGVEQILVNLIVNARDAMPEGGSVTIRTWAGVADPEAGEAVLEGPHVVLSVEDTGEGMDAATLKQAFDPFFTTKGVGEGSGLGLASVYGIVQQSQGHVDVRSVLGDGTEFRIYLPQADEGGGDLHGEASDEEPDEAVVS